MMLSSVLVYMPLTAKAVRALGAIRTETVNGIEQRV